MAAFCSYGSGFVVYPVRIRYVHHLDELVSITIFLDVLDLMKFSAFNILTTKSLINLLCGDDTVLVFVKSLEDLGPKLLHFG